MCTVKSQGLAPSMRAVNNIKENTLQMLYVFTKPYFSWPPLKKCFSIWMMYCKIILFFAPAHLLRCSPCTSSLCWYTVSAHRDSSHRSNISDSHLPATLYYPSFSYSLSVSPSWINIPYIHSVLAWNGHTAPGTRRSDAAIIIPLQWSHTSIFHQSCGSLPWLLFGWLKQMMWQWGGPAYHSPPC